jgi:ceramide kinase
VGVLNTAPDGKFVHPSDGNLDLVITRKGNLLQTLHLGILYLFGKEFKSPLITYKKVKAVVIEQYEPENSVNIDGEVLLGPGPWRMEIVPSLFKALSEK